MITFYTLLGKYRFLGMPIGLRMGQDTIQKKIDQT